MGNANSRSVEVCDAAKQVMACRERWLAAVGAALRMSEAENELNSSSRALVFPLVSFGQPVTSATVTSGRRSVQPR